MSKKKKQNLQRLIAKRQQLQQIAQGAVVSFDDTAEIEQFQKPQEAIIPPQAAKPKPRSDRALRKTALSLLIIAALLVGAVYFDRKSPYFNEFGNWLYSALRLSS